MLFFLHHFEHHVQPIVLRMDVLHHHGDQQQIHQPQQQRGPQHQLLQGQEQLPLGIHPQPLLAEQRYQVTAGSDLPLNNRDGNDMRPAPGSVPMPQSVRDVYMDTHIDATPGSPVEESSSEEGRSALFISTQTALDSPHSREAARGRLDREGLRERRLLHFENTSSI